MSRSQIPLEGGTPVRLLYLLPPSGRARSRYLPRSNIWTQKGIVYSAEERRENGGGSIVTARGKLNSISVENAAPIT
jgi:hypothetical protein